jgi:hypothetical protein
VRIPFLRRRRVKQMMSAPQTLEYLIGHRQQWAAQLGERHASDLVESFLRAQKRPRRERRAWQAFLFGGAARHPDAFPMMGELYEGETQIDHRMNELVALADWPAVEQHLLSEGWAPEVVADILRYYREGGDLREIGL